MKRQYRLTAEDLKTILHAGKPTPVMFLSGGVPMFSSPQENANSAWKEIAPKYGFEWDSAEDAGTGDPPGGGEDNEHGGEDSSNSAGLPVRR